MSAYQIEEPCPDCGELECPGAPRFKGLCAKPRRSSSGANVRYGNVAIGMREDLGAEGVVLLVLGGKKGSGFAVSLSAEVNEGVYLEAVAGALEDIAKTLRERAGAIR